MKYRCEMRPAKSNKETANAGTAMVMENIILRGSQLVVCVSSKNASKYINDEKCQTNPSSRDFRMMRLVTVVGPRRHIFIAKAPFRPEM